MFPHKCGSQPTPNQFRDQKRRTPATAVSAYGYKGTRRVKKFIRNHFPADYKPHAYRIYPEYRLSLVHAWNLFDSVALMPGNEPISDLGGQLQFGLLNFKAAFEQAVADFLNKLSNDHGLQERALFRYREIVGEVKPSKPMKREFIFTGVGLVIGVTAGILAHLKWSK